MRVVELQRFGAPDVLRVGRRPRPDPAAGHLLVRVAAAGVNFADTLMRRDRYALTPELPSVLGHEVSGVVEALGAGVAGPGPGTRVAAPLFAAGSFFGGYAEYATIDARFAVPIPSELSFEDATALMVQGLTALHLTRRAAPAGKTVLVNAAAGGVGSLLVQLARRAGASRVLAGVGSAAKAELALSLGADAAVDYTRGSWIEEVRAESAGAGPDLIYESAGGDVMPASLRALAPLGEIVVYGALNIQEFSLGVPELLGLIFRNQSVTGFALAPLLTPDLARAGLEELFGLAARGHIRLTRGGTFPFDRAADAHRALEERRTVGKLVLVP